MWRWEAGKGRLDSGIGERLGDEVEILGENIDGVRVQGYLMDDWAWKRGKAWVLRDCVDVRNGSRSRDTWGRDWGCQ